MPFLRLSCLATVGLLLCHSAAHAQTAGFGSISGTATDPSGAVVPGAAITVHNEDTGVNRSFQTNDSGIYVAAFLPPGNYDVVVAKAGFASLDRKALTVQVGRNLSINFAMTVATGTQTVEVTAAAPIIDPDKTEFSQEVSQNMVSNLPIVGRRWDNFVLLTPGVTTDGGLVSYRGISGLYNNNSVDGANNNQAFFSEARGRSTVPYTYSLDSIQEFQVSASNYSSEFGQAAGGVVNAVTKSGSNTLHGDLFYYLRYPALNALDSYGKSHGVYTQAVHQQQQFGGSVGGAIIKDKLFYFFTYDGSRKVFPIIYTSSASFPLSCGAISRFVTAGQCANANSYLQSLTGGYGRTASQNLGFGKLDYQINSKNRVSASFDLDNFFAPNSYNSSTSVANNSVTANGPVTTHTRFLVGNWDSTITNTVVNNFRFQWAQDNEIIGNNAPGPNVSIANVMAYGMPNALPRPAFPNEHRLQFADTVSQSLGKHQFKYGVDVNNIHELLVNLFQGGGVYSYAGTQTGAFDNWVLDTYGINTGDGLTGKHYSSFAQVVDPITGVGRDDFYDNDVAGFFEDDWKLRSNLTLNLGVRYEVQMIPQPPKPNTATPLTTLYTSTINIDTNNFGPRIGLAWQPDKTTVVRVGYGIFYAKTSNSTFYASRVENGVYQQTFNCTPASCPALQAPNLIFTPPGGTPVPPFAGAVTPQVVPFTPPALTQLSHGLTPDFVNPLVHEGEATVEQQLPGSFSLSLSYLFSRGLHLPVFVDSNLTPATTTHSYDILSGSGALLQRFSLPWYTTRLNPATGQILNGYSSINSNYNALAVTLRRQFNRGLEMTLNYTWSKSLDDGAVAGANGTFYGTDPPLDPYNQRGEYGLSDLDQRHRFVGSLVYAPQIFRNAGNRAVRTALNGWTFSGVATVASGQPVFSTISGFPSGAPDYGLTGGEVTNTGGSTGGRPSQYGRNVFIAPPLHDIDLRVMRQFPIRERVSLELLGEAFNIANHTNVTSVNGTAYTFSASSACAAARSNGANGCLTPSPVFLTPTSTSSANGLYGSRQLQVSAKLTF